MSTDSMNEVSGNLRVERRWASIPQIVMYLIGVLLTLWLVNLTQNVTFLLIAPVVVILASPLGKYGRMVLLAPLKWRKRVDMARKHNIVSKMTPQSAPIAGGTAPREGFRDAFHGSIKFRDEEGNPDILPLFVDGAKRRGSLIVTATGLKVGAGGDEETRQVHADIIADGMRDAVNSTRGPLTITNLRIMRPGDVHRAMGYVEDEMADDVRSAKQGTPLADVRTYAVERAWTGTFMDITRAFVVSANLGPLAGNVDETLFDGKTRKKLPSNTTVFDSPLWLAAERLHAGLVAAGAQSPVISDAAGQALTIGLSLTTHPEDLEAWYRRAQTDDRQVRTHGEIAVDQSQLAGHGPFPFAAQVGRDWVLTGRTYHRVLHVLGGRGRTLPLGLADRFMVGADYPVIFSSVHSSRPGRWEQYTAEERARMQETIRNQRAQGYENVPARLQRPLEEATSARDDTFLSGAPGTDISNGVIVSAVSLKELSKAESLARQQLSQLRVDAETVVGNEEQVPWLLYFLGIGTL